jgi:transposase
MKVCARRRCADLPSGHLLNFVVNNLEEELDDQDREQLVELLEKGPQAHGRETDLWTSKRVFTVIEDYFEIDYPALHCSRILREFG